jgi:hypothetical protein
MDEFTVPVSGKLYFELLCRNIRFRAAVDRLWITRADAGQVLAITRGRRMVRRKISPRAKNIIVVAHDHDTIYETDKI